MSFKLVFKWMLAFVLTFNVLTNATSFSYAEEVPPEEPEEPKKPKKDKPKEPVPNTGV